MPGKKGGKKKGKKGKKGGKSKKGTKDVEKKSDGTIPDALPKLDYLPPVRAPGESLVDLLTTHVVEQKEIHNIKVNVKILEELMPQEIRDLRFVFKTFDANEDGLLTSHELEQAFKVLGFKVTPADATIMCSESGLMRKAAPSVDLNDFLGYVIERQGESYDFKDEIVQGFKMFDYDTTGLLTIDNLRQAAKDADVQISEEELREMLEEADLNGDGAIDQEEFINIMQQTNLFA
ncbi:uncharacterized protein LOC141899663 [Tubulanus polymorphus]|uniref:uncharacterized protein LOC141899663 n=1 Tax=Tubulanus polymorphus TaxID=672921 RepID=UPI003DA6CD4F